ncbi:vWA domain-containing protein [Fulvivirga sedimenti]|uniref:VWA domain-containing protein n=1 Tax=Fulvivirga sedimenti TaxID=2879465 RepID=A0A9X1HJV6_9BACT|nr:VWA domain-containing protein [Fulvivirga sedimenti]MCA6073509.1 VWA domain-containing protein [Fulvivirga sedimenti]
MSWLYGLSLVDKILIALFLVLYGLYFFRLIVISRKLPTRFNGITFKFLLRSLYFTLLVIALIGPSFGESKREVKSVGKDIFLLVDLSESMEANDVQPTRLAKVKFELKNIVEAFSSDRLGIIIFSSEAFMQAPLTYDQNALNLFIETLNTGLVPNAGTDFGPPLRMALEKLQDDDSPVTQQKSKIIILISDGEDFGDDTSEEVDKIETAGIRLFTLGVGTEKGSKIRNRSGFKKDREGQDVVTRLESRSLRKLASDTEGKYFEINATRNDVSRLINTVNSIEGEVRDTRQIDVSANRFYYFVIIALGLILVDIFTSFKTVRI